MKNKFILCLFFLAACNNEKSDSTTEKAVTTSDEKDSPAKATAAGCSKLYLFHKGAVIENASYDASGKEISRQLSTVLEVNDNPAGVSSLVEMKSTENGKNEIVVNGKYSCDGQTLSIDLESLFASMKEKGGKVEGDPITFPLDLSEGQELPDAKYSFIMAKGGSEMRTTATMKERKVEGRETINTPAGTFDCFKVSSTIDASMEFPGMDEKAKQAMEAMKKNMPKQRFVMYFDPSVGIVRSDMYNGSTLVTKSEVTSIKH